MKESGGALPRTPMDGVDAVISGWAAGLCHKTLSEGPPRNDMPLARAPPERELAARKEFDAHRPVVRSTKKKTIAETRRELAWEVVVAQTSAKARPVITGFQGPDLHQGLVETAGCVSMRSFHLRLLRLRALEK